MNHSWRYAWSVIDVMILVIPSVLVEVQDTAWIDAFFFWWHRVLESSSKRNEPAAQNALLIQNLHCVLRVDAEHQQEDRRYTMRSPHPARELTRRQGNLLHSGSRSHNHALEAVADTGLAYHEVRMCSP